MNRSHLYLVITLIFLFAHAVSCVMSQNLPASLWKVIYASSEEQIKDQPNCRKELIIDNDESTFWHSRYSDYIARNPHEIRIDLSASAYLRFATLIPRQKNSSGKCLRYEISVSEDGQTWPVVRKGSFYWSGNSDFSSKQIELKSKGRYIRFRHLQTYLNGISDSSVASLAEFKLDGYYTSALVVPDFSIEHLPKQLAVGSTVYCRNTSRSYQSRIASYTWVCKGAVLQTNGKYDCTISFNKPGIYEIQLSVKDFRGQIRKKSLQKRLVVYPAPLIESRLLRVDSCSDEEAEYDHSASNTLSSSMESYWKTSWDQLVQLPHFIIYDLGKPARISGIAYLPLTISNNGHIVSYSIFVSDDKKNWGKPVVSGNSDAADKTLQIIPFKPVKGQYLKFQINQTMPEGSNFAAFSKFYVYGEFVTEGFHLTYILPFFGVLLLLFFIIARKRQMNKIHSVVSGSTTLIRDITQTEQVLDKSLYKTHIYLFGNFRIVHDSQAVTGNISPKIKQLFVLLLLHPQGISIHKLADCLWPGMPSDKIANTRGTTIQRLKQILAKIQGVSLEYNQKSWFLTFDQSVFVDWYHYQQRIEELRLHSSDAALQSLCEIIDKPLLPEIEEEWLDLYKAQTSNDIVDLLMQQTEMPLVRNNAQKLLLFTDLILTHDELNVDALKLKVQALITLNKQSQARQTYDIFAKKYRTVYLEDFCPSFSELVKELGL